MALIAEELQGDRCPHMLPQDPMVTGRAHRDYLATASNPFSFNPESANP